MRTRHEPTGTTSRRPCARRVIFAGAARTPFFDGALVTFSSGQAAEAARILGARRVVVAHTDGWAHFTEDRTAVERAFADPDLDDVLQHD